MTSSSDLFGANIFEQISHICQDFRKQFSQGKSPGIENYLMRISEDGRESLFLNLLEIEINYRRSKGQTPSSEDYVKRFSQYVKQVRRAFFEPSMASLDFGSTRDEAVTQSLQGAVGSSDRTRTFQTPSANRLGNYELLRELGRGGMGVVYEARHTQNNNRVALKTLPTGGDGKEINADKLYQFRREFRRLSEINHPNLVGMQSLEVEGSQWFFTMDIIDGEDFLGFVRPNDELDEDRLRKCLPQLVHGVIAMHRDGIVHRDLKPSNVMVSTEGQVSILDFGLAAEMQKTNDMTQTRSGMFAGTPKYAAPEQMFGERTEASDWYAFGVMLYEALMGVTPFTTKDPMQLLQDKQNREAPRLTEKSDVPTDLAKITDGLIRREPGERFSAASLIEIFGLDLETRTGGSTVGSQDSAGSVSDEEINLELIEEEEVVLIGREKQLSQLDEIKSQFLQTRRPQVVWVKGLSGEGKSSLVANFLKPIRTGSELLVLSGRCYDRESVPFKAVDTIINSLVRFLRLLSDEEVESTLPTDIEMLAYLFPLLRRVPAIKDRMQQQVALLNSRQIRYRAFEAMRVLFERIGELTPVILMIDDLQWGDADSASALHSIIYSELPPPVLFIGTYRSDELDESSFHRQWQQLDEDKPLRAGAKEIYLEALQREQCIALIKDRLKIEDAEIRIDLEELFANTRGNPYLVEQLIEGFNANISDWRPLPLNEIIVRKLGRLPDESKLLLETIAISGKAVQADELALISELDNGVYSLLTHMRSERLVRMVGSGEGQLVDTWHDKIRETVLDQMGADRRAAMHLKYGEVLEASECLSESLVESYLRQSFTNPASADFRTERVFDLAYHFQLAGDQRAFAYQFLAGELAFQNYASEEAIEYLMRSKSLFGERESAGWKPRLYHRLAVSFGRIMEFDASLENFNEGVEFARKGLEKAHFYSGIASTYQTRTEYRKASENHDLALAEIGKKRPKGIFAYPRAILDLTKMAIFPDSWMQKKSTGISEEDKLEQAILPDALMYLFDMRVPLIEYPATFLRLGILSRRSNSTEFLSGLAVTGSNLAVSGLSKLGERLAQEALRQVKDSKNAESEGLCRYTTATALCYTANFVEADKEFRRSVALLRRSGNHFHLAVALHMWRHLHEGVGKASSEIEAANKLIELSKRSDNLRGLCWGHYDLGGGSARHGRIADSLAAIQAAGAIHDKLDLHLTTPIYFAQRSFVLLQASQYKLSELSSDYSWRYAWKHLRTMDVCLRGLPWYLESAAGPSWATDSSNLDRKLLLKRCRWARGLARFHPKIRPHLFRARGRAFVALGKLNKGIRNFELAAKSAGELEMKYDLGKSLLDLSAVKEKNRDENRKKAIRLLREMESVIPRAESWLLGDHYDESVVAPEFDLETWERENGSMTMNLNQLEAS